MSEFRLASRYAKSVIELAEEKGQLDKVHNDIRLLQQTFRSSKDLVSMLKNPVVYTDKKIRILEMLFKDKINPITYEFLKLVTAKKRENHLPTIVQSFIDQYNKLQEIVTVNFTTPVAVDPALEEKIKEIVRKATGKSNIDLRTKVNPNIIGGYILQYEDKQYDASVFRHLETLDDNFLGNVYRKVYG